MDLRVTPQALISQTIASMRLTEDRLANLQEQAATGKRLLRPSDNPADAVTVLSVNATDLRLDTYLNNINGAQTTLNTSTSALQEASTILSQAREAAISGSNGTNDP